MSKEMNLHNTIQEVEAMVLWLTQFDYGSLPDSGLFHMISMYGCGILNDVPVMTIQKRWERYKKVARVDDDLPF